MERFILFIISVHYQFQSYMFDYEYCRITAEVLVDWIFEALKFYT